MYVVMCMLIKMNLKKENIAADLVIWIINKWNKVNINQRYMYISFCSSLYVPTLFVSVFMHY